MPDAKYIMQDNSSLRDELSMSKSTILHLIHELNQAKAAQTMAPVHITQGDSHHATEAMIQGQLQKFMQRCCW